MNYVFTTLSWLLLFFAGGSLLTSAYIVFKVVRRAVGDVDKAIFSGMQDCPAPSARKPGTSFLVILLFDLASLIAILTVMYDRNMPAYLSWSILVIVLLYYIIKMRYFIRLFHNLGVLDDEDLEDLGMDN